MWIGRAAPTEGSRGPVARQMADIVFCKNILFFAKTFWRSRPPHRHPGRRKVRVREAHRRQHCVQDGLRGATAPGGQLSGTAAPEALAGDARPAGSEGTTQVGTGGFQPLRSATTRWRSAAPCVKLASSWPLSVRLSPPRGHVGSTSGVRQGREGAHFPPSASPKRISGHPPRSDNHHLPRHP
jgi:hypothetical protein